MSEGKRIVMDDSRLTYPRLSSRKPDGPRTCTRTTISQERAVVEHDRGMLTSASKHMRATL